MTVLLALLLAPFWLLTAFFVVEVLAGLARSRPASAARSEASAVVVIPAHDEAAVIGATLQSIKSALWPGARVLVVADNCFDDTAERARDAGAEVIERRDPERRGKGHALAFAAEHLRSDPPDVLVVMDADCTIERDSLQALVATAAARGRPCQSINLLRPDQKTPAMVQLSTFAFMLKNLVRQRGLYRLARRVHLTGTGMAMPFHRFDASAHVRSSIVEDLALGLDLAEQGAAPMLVADARVWSSGSTQQGTLVQRRRWEGGFLATALKRAPKVMARGLAHGDIRAVAAGLDLMVPPLALFAMLNLLALALACAVTIAFGLGWWPVLVHGALLVAAGLAVLLAWAREGRPFVSAGVLARLPFYILWKLPLYLGLARRGAPAEWLRTGR